MGDGGLLAESGRRRYLARLSTTEKLDKRNVMDAIWRYGFALTDVPIGHATPIVRDTEAIDVVVGRQRAKSRGSDRYLYSAEADVPIDIVFDDQRSRTVTREERSQCIQVTKPS